ncbi:Fic family protein [Phenylobacterium sp.]|uniref:Fic family protein n=1 Tax=Phenylobacterium sp. TaxID=1871053 RepID=UPI0035B2359C
MSATAVVQKDRAGRYVRQTTGYSAFIPNPLPPRDIAIDSEMQTLLSRADRALGRLDGSIQTLPNPDLFVFMYVRKEAVLSSQIEGTQSSLADVLEVEASVFDPQHPSDVGEVLNYVTAMNYGLNRLTELPLCVRLIKEIHNELLHNVRGREKNPGEIRTSQNWIGPGGCTLQNATFVPPPPHEVMSALSDLETFMHSDAQIPALIKIGLIHAQFETIHPFLDGNGRIGRLLITFLLMQSEILLKPVLYISHYFKRNRYEYYEKLQSVRDNGDWENWIKFFLKGIATVSLEATETARSIVGLREEHRALVTSRFGRAAGNGLTILETLFRSPIITVGQVQKTLKITYPPANGLVQRFVDAGILFEITGQERYRVYQYSPYINLFAENREEPQLDHGPSQG